MKPRKRTLMAFAIHTALLAFTAGGSADAVAASSDLLAITDQGDPGSESDDSVRFFDATTGAPLTSPVVPPGTGLAGPAGILFSGRKGEFVVVNQLIFHPTNGEVIQYDASGNRIATLVSRDDPNGPLGPRGAVMVVNKDGSRTLFVADQGDFDFDTGARTSGKLLAYRVEHTKATFLKNLDPNLKNPGATGPQFQPRSVVLGPDGYLYVTLRNLPEPCGGSIVRFDPDKLSFKDVLVSNPADCAQNDNDLHRPEGLVFSPEGDLYVTSFRKNANDNDRILIIPRKDRVTGHVSTSLDRIDLYRVSQGQSRAYAQALLFGPNGNLFIPIFYSDSNTGEVRRYNVQTKTYQTFIGAGRGLIAPQYLSFGNTNPATLVYESQSTAGHDENQQGGGRGSLVSPFGR